MRTLQSVLVVAVLGAVAAAFLPACGSDSDTSSPGPVASAGAASSMAGAPAGMAGAPAGMAGAPAGTAGMTMTGGAGAATMTPAGDVAKGMTVFTTNKGACTSCHGTMAEGSIGPNITGSMTAGIGAWTEMQFYNAVRNAKARSGTMLCSTMQLFPASTVSDQDIADMYAYLQTLKNDTANLGFAMCNTQ